MENIYPLPIGLAQAASTRPALHAALRTLGQLGYRFVKHVGVVSIADAIRMQKVVPSTYRR